MATPRAKRPEPIADVCWRDLRVFVPFVMVRKAVFSVSLSSVLSVVELLLSATEIKLLDRHRREAQNEHHDSEEREPLPA